MRAAEDHENIGAIAMADDILGAIERLVRDARGGCAQVADKFVNHGFVGARVFHEFRQEDGQRLHDVARGWARSLRRCCCRRGDGGSPPEGARIRTSPSSAENGPTPPPQSGPVTCF